MPTKITVTCDTCGQSIEKYPSLLRAHNFCSPACYSKWRKTRTKETNPHWRGGSVSLVCPQCGQTFMVPAITVSRRRYCSIECKGLAQRSQQICIQCGRAFNGQSRTFCSFACFAAYRRLHPETHPMWVDGHARSPYAAGWNRISRRRLVLERDGFKCRACGINIGTKRRSCVIHHLDFSKTNHELSNLMTLCFPCHARVHDGSIVLSPSS